MRQFMQGRAEGHRCRAAFALAVVGGLLPAIAVAQQPYPVKPVRIVTPYPPGGVNDVIGRLVGQKLAEAFGHPVLLDNRPGGNTIIGTGTVAKSVPDGYTLLQVSGSYILTALLLPTPYDAAADLAPVTTLASTEFVLVVHPSLPVRSVQDLVALAKARPGQLNYASTGAGGIVHVTSELFNQRTGVRIQHIAYKGGGPAITDLMAGQVHMHFSAPIAVVSQIRSGRLKAIAIGGDKRSPVLPQVPTFTESGLPAFHVKSWYGLLAPAGTPRSIVERLSTEVSKIVLLAEIREKLQSQAMEPFVSTPEQMGKLIASDRARFIDVVKTAGIKVESF